MAKDYLKGLDHRMSRMQGQYDFFVAAGDLPGCAFDKTIDIAKREMWEVRALMGHARHGRCGGNANEAMPVLMEFLTDLKLAGRR